MMSSFQANFQNLLQKSDLKSSDIQKAFAQAPPPIDTSLIRNYAIFGLQNIVLQNNVAVLSGSAGVQNDSPNIRLPNKAEIVIGGGSRFVDPNSARLIIDKRFVGVDSDPRL